MDFLNEIETLSESTLGMKFWCLLIVYFTFILSWRPNYTYSVGKYGTLKRGRTIALFMCILIIALTWWVDTDYYEYIRLSNSGNVGWEFSDSLTLEKGHQAILSLIDGDWFLFRVICWGGALTLFSLLAKRFKINVQQALFCLFIIWIHTFSYARVSLAMAVYFFGLSFLCKSAKPKLLSVILGICILLTSFYFHRSALLLIAITPVILIPLINKQMSFAFVLSSLIFIALCVIAGIGLLYQTSGLDEITTEKLKTYSERNMGGMSIFTTVITYLNFSAKYAPAIAITYILVKLRQTALPLFVRQFYVVMIVIIALAIAFYFSGEAQYTLFYRTLNFIMIPTSILLAYLHYNGYMSKRVFFYSIILGACEILSRVTFWILFALGFHEML